MTAPGPRTTLLLLCGLAAVILVGGVRLARVEEHVRVDRDRAALRQFAGEIQGELQRLDALYESHLVTLVRTLPSDPFVIRRESDRIVGVRQFSVLHRTPSLAVSDLHVPVNAVPSERLPAPALAAPPANSVRTPAMINDQVFANEGARSGWIDAPDRPLFFWMWRTSEEAAVFTIDPRAVEAAFNQRLAKWTPGGLEAWRAAGGPDQLRDRSGRALLAVGETLAGQPDLLLPLRSRFGGWELASWDRRETRVSYHRTTLIVSGAVAALVAALGAIAFGQQRRAAVLAAQRVSFVNHVSHELRSPLTNILLNADLASIAVKGDPLAAGRRLALVQEEARRLSRLIDNVLTFSRHEQGRRTGEAHACVPASVIGAVIEQFSASFARRALQVVRSGEAGAACVLDADALAQILANLLSNVEKYVPGGTVEITANVADSFLAVTVADEGPGIPAESVERIFRPFERLDNRVNEGASGTGLGLAIARDLATGMGGSLRLVLSERGACFELRVPSPPAREISAVA